jgi:hypothetical protein
MIKLLFVYSVWYADINDFLYSYVKVYWTNHFLELHLLNIIIGLVIGLIVFFKVKEWFILIFKLIIYLLSRNKK